MPDPGSGPKSMPIQYHMGSGTDLPRCPQAMRHQPLPPAQTVLSVDGLTLMLRRRRDQVALVEDIGLDIAAGEAVGLVGESGCGKSVTALAIMRLLPRGRIVPTAGSIRLEGRDLLSLDEQAMRRVRGNRVAMIFQEPMTSLHPLFPIGRQIGEALALHRHLHGAAARAEAARLLDLVGIGGARSRLDDLPGAMSGGQRQRVMIAMALACNPVLLIADEPTTALDATIQAQIMRLIDGLRRELGMALLLISHDLAVVAAHCDRACVMYAGQIVERAAARDIVERPRHPYTDGLIRCVPEIGAIQSRLPTIPGTVPAVDDRGMGCRFRPRCGRAVGRCAAENPADRPLAGAHPAACWNPAA